MTTSNNNKNNRINEAKVNIFVYDWIETLEHFLERKQSTKKHMNSSTWIRFKKMIIVKWHLLHEKENIHSSRFLKLAIFSIVLANEQIVESFFCEQQINNFS